MATRSSRRPALTVSTSACTASSGVANVRWPWPAVAPVPERPHTTTPRANAIAVAVFAMLSARFKNYRRLPPPPLPPPPPLEDDEPRLLCPRELAARVDCPLEYPENASERVPLLSCVAARPPDWLCPRAS